jgi:hypothetical protein
VKRDGLQPNVVFAFGSTDLRVGVSVAHQARQTPSLEVAAVSGCALTNGVRSSV